MTTCQDCGNDTGKPLAKFCDGCRVRHRGKPPLYMFTPERRAYIQAHYSVSDKGMSLRIARVLSVPKWRVVRWAAEMGLCTPAPKSPDWTDQDVAFLESHIGSRTPNWIAKRLKRSVTAVVVKAKRLQIDRRGCRDWMTASSVALGFGLEVHAVIRWIEKGWLEADRFGQNHSDGRPCAWKIWPQAVRRFVREHPTAFPLAKVDQVWFLVKRRDRKYERCPSAPAPSKPSFWTQVGPGESMTQRAEAERARMAQSLIGRSVPHQIMGKYLTLARPE